MVAETRPITMFHNWINKHHIVLKKGQRIHILSQLFWNKILYIKLGIFKSIHSIQHPIIHFYALCWNEERILPFVLDYYGRFVDHITVYDNHSTDHSREIILSYPNTKVVEFGENEFDDTIHNDIKNNCWKQSRGKADFVVVCDMDEFLYSPDIKTSLEQLISQRISVVQPEGYDMYSEDYPSYSKGHLITDIVKHGIRSQWFAKCILFDPHAVVEINYKPGAHECHPVGRINRSSTTGFKLLHYKNIGIKQTIQRIHTYAQRLSKENIEKALGTHYLEDEQKQIEEFKNNERQATEII